MVLQKLGPCSIPPFFHHWAIGISDCGFYTPIVLPNCPMKSIESADFYENGVSPALPFMITLWPLWMKGSAAKSAAQTIAGC